MWDAYLSVNEYNQRVKQVDDATSIYDGPHFLEVPKSKNYDTKSIMEALILMAHEIGAHYANQDISEKAGFKIRGK